MEKLTGYFTIQTGTGLTSAYAIAAGTGKVEEKPVGNIAEYYLVVIIVMKNQANCSPSTNCLAE